MLEEHMPDLDVLEADAPSRICPMFAGPTLLDQKGLMVRLPDGDLRVQINRRLVRTVFNLCDGTRSMTELIAIPARRAERDELERCLQFLLEAGALVDASQYVMHATRFGWGHQPFGQAADPARTRKIAERFKVVSIDTQQADTRASRMSYMLGTLHDCFAQRRSTYIFDERPLPRAALDALLWSLAGVVRETHERTTAGGPRRTVPSAGELHLLEVYLALQRPYLHTDEEALSEPELLPSGLYRIRYPSAHRVQYELLTKDLSRLPRAVAKPEYLHSSTGILFVAADARRATLRYRNRAIQYLFSEAGMALQNGALAATRLDVGLAAFGSYYEGDVQNLFDIPDRMILGSAIFGPRPTAEQEAAVQHCPGIEFAWADAHSDQFNLPYFVGRAKIKDDPNGRPTWGRDVRPELAHRKAVAEAIERLGYREPRGLQSGRMVDMDHALDPRLVVQFSPAQYRVPTFPFKNFEPTAKHLWVEGVAAGTGRKVAVLADLVFASDALQTKHRYRATYWRANSSGCAAGTTPSDAQLAAVLELAERDAFMRHWLSQKPGTGIAEDSLPASLRQRIAAIRATGFAVSVQHLPSKVAPVIFLFARHALRQATCVSAGAGLTLEKACLSALVELESRVFSILHGHAVPPLNPTDVQSPDDHFALYTRPNYFDRADGLLPGEATASWKTVAQQVDLRTRDLLYEKMHEAQLEPVFIDITPSRNGISNGRERLAVCRAIVPGLIPMSFGFGMEPRAMMPIHPKARFPHPFP